ncbi:MAG TPA: hypothetical protein VFH36_04530 [Acidimicrobiales bacterium]|nr:hypothetical protein [Acidimicrobiales bacterium]
MTDWAAEQRAFYQDYLARRGGAERRLVKIRWWTARGGRGSDVMGVLARLWSGKRAHRGDEQVFVALYAAADPVGARPFLVMPAVDRTFTEASGRATATVVGRAEPGGALVIETRQGEVLPAQAPGEPGDDAPSWSEVGTGGTGAGEAGAG